jgi:hypothetical protein
MPDLKMEPIYWAPVGDIADVVRGTWFYKDTMLPVETPVANMLEVRNRPALERQGKVCKVWDAAVWKDLPIFGPQMREAWNEGKLCPKPLLFKKTEH